MANGISTYRLMIGTIDCYLYPRKVKKEHTVLFLNENQAGKQTAKTNSLLFSFSEIPFKIETAV